MRSRAKVLGLFTAALLAYATPNFAILTVQNPATDTVPPTPEVAANQHYILGSNDEIVVFALYADELSNKTIRISPSGDVNLPQVGRIHAAGMSVADLEAVIVERLKPIIKQPDVVVSVTKFASQPVTVVGEVGKPGIVQLEGNKSLMEVLALAGGPAPTAGSRVQITRKIEEGPIPLPSARSAGDYSVAEVDVTSIGDGSRPADNIQILPYDVISVSRADIVYVVGSVNKAGGFDLKGKRSISVTEALARAEGLLPTAAKKSAKIIRGGASGEKNIEIPINLDDVLKGKTASVMLQPDDLLLVPESYGKSQARRTLETVIQMTTGMAIYH